MELADIIVGEDYLVLRESLRDVLPQPHAERRLPGRPLFDLVTDHWLRARAVAKRGTSGERGALVSMEVSLHLPPLVALLGEIIATEHQVEFTIPPGRVERLWAEHEFHEWSRQDEESAVREGTMVVTEAADQRGRRRDSAAIKHAAGCPELRRLAVMAPHAALALPLETVSACSICLRN